MPVYDTLDDLVPPLTLAQRTTDGEGKVKSEVHKRAGRDPETAVKISEAVVKRTSTLFDREGNVSAQWVIETPEEKARLAALEAWLEQAMQVVPAKPLIMPVVTRRNEDLMVGYPVGDHHLGMLAWKHEVGESYDIDISRDLLISAFTQLIASAPPAEQALIAFLGDFFHYDSFDQVTPTHRNLLDADGRAPKMIGVGWEAMETVIDMAAQRHNKVRVIIELGNHDTYTSVVSALMLQRIYRDNPRISIDINPSRFHYWEWGKVLIGTHHGHGRNAKPMNLPGIMAADKAEAWGRTRYRYWWTGHIHSQKVFDNPGALVESFRILAPADAYAHNEGYRAGREMNAITLHREFGEVGRIKVNPDMLRRST